MVCTRRPGGGDARDDAEDFLRRAAFRDPVGVSRLNQLLVVLGGKIAANDDEEDVSVSLVDDVDQRVEVLPRGGRNRDGDRALRPFERGRADVSYSRNPFEIRDRGSDTTLDLDERPLVAVGVQEIDRHDCSRVTTLRLRICRARGSRSREEISGDEAERVLTGSALSRAGLAIS